MIVDELRFPAMGSDVHVLVVGGEAAIARQTIDGLEQLWSRFLPDSEIARLNRAGGQAVPASTETRQLLRACVTGWRVTDGAFDPTVAEAMDANGYPGRGLAASHLASGARWRGSGRAIAHRNAQGAPGMGGVEVDDVAGTARCPAGVSVDPGGIGKGLAADLAVAALAAGGASGAMVSVGGDVRVWGRPPRGGAWTLAVQDPFAPERDTAAVVLRDGGVATSSILGRRWELDGSPMHHVVDPATGAPLDNDVVAVTAVAGTAWWAEVLTKAVLVTAGRGDAVGDDAAVLWHGDGSRHEIGRAAAYFTEIPAFDGQETYA